MPIFVWFQAPIKGLGFLYFVSWTDKARSKPGEMSSYKNFDWWAEICFRFASLCSDLQFVVSCHEAFGSHMLKKIKWKVSLNQTCDPLIKRLLLALLLTGLAQATQRWCHTLQVTTRKQTQAQTHRHIHTHWEPLSLILRALTCIDRGPEKRMYTCAHTTKVGCTGLLDYWLQETSIEKISSWCRNQLIVTALQLQLIIAMLVTEKLK